MGNFFGCGKEGHKVRYCSNVRSHENGNCKKSRPSSYSPRKNRIYALRSSGDQEESPDVVTGTLYVFYIDFYDLLDAGGTLSFVTPLVDKIFDVLPNILIKPFSVTTSVDDSIVARRVFRGCPISFPNRVTWVDLVEFDMVDFDVFWEWIGCMLVLLS